jgi:hypothetical protein
MEGEVMTTQTTVAADSGNESRKAGPCGLSGNGHRTVATRCTLVTAGAESRQQPDVFYVTNFIPFVRRWNER